jgi:EAL domain-containing protein (putative c-di-GMP-specific phosphodiesterase class I)
MRLAAEVEDSSSTLARVGGDEFALLSEDTGGATSAFSLGESLRAALVAPFLVEGHEIFVTASVGVALGPGGDATGLLRDAGIATHHAKQQGRDRTSMFDVRLDPTQRRRLTMQNELRHALKRDELEIWYQPMVDLQTNLIVGAEALVRWQHPSRGLLGPEQFIDVAEASGMIRNLGSQVLRQACADAHAWQSAGTPLRISINAAAAQLNSRGFVDEIEVALRDFDLDPEQMTIEITETAAMQVSGSLDALHRIRNLGLHLALDDFGTGYSSLSFLRDLPIDAIKIDRAFIGGIGISERDTSIVQGVLAIAAALGHAVVAEGVETREQAAWLRAAHCEYGQGYLWSRPVPAQALQSVSILPQLHSA